LWKWRFHSKILPVLWFCWNHSVISNFPRNVFYVSWIFSPMRRRTNKHLCFKNKIPIELCLIKQIIEYLFQTDSDLAWHWKKSGLEVELVWDWFLLIDHQTWLHLGMLQTSELRMCLKSHFYDIFWSKILRECRLIQFHFKNQAWFRYVRFWRVLASDSCCWNDFIHNDFRFERTKLQRLNGWYSSVDLFRITLRLGVNCTASPLDLPTIVILFLFITGITIQIFDEIIIHIFNI
jgi:hypothetical protein